MKDISKEKLYGIVGTLVFHILVAVLLCLMVMEQIPIGLWILVNIYRNG